MLPVLMQRIVIVVYPLPMHQLVQPGMRRFDRGANLLELARRRLWRQSIYIGERPLNLLQHGDGIFARLKGRAPLTRAWTQLLCAAISPGRPPWLPRTRKRNPRRLTD